MQRPQKKPKRKYYRKCGLCDERHEQSEMLRVKEALSPNGWICRNCFEDIARRYIFDEDYDEGEF